MITNRFVNILEKISQMDTLLYKVAGISEPDANLFEVDLSCPWMDGHRTFIKLDPAEHFTLVQIEHIWAFLDMELDGDDWCSQLFCAFKKNTGGFNASGYYLAIREWGDSNVVSLNRSIIALNAWSDVEIQTVLDLFFSDLANCLGLIDSSLTVFKRIDNSD